MPRLTYQFQQLGFNYLVNTLAINFSKDKEYWNTESLDLRQLLSFVRQSRASLSRQRQTRR